MRENIELQSQKKLLNDAKEKIRKYKSLDNFGKGQLVRIKMSSLFSNIRSVIKSGDSKQIVVNWTPISFIVWQVIQPKETTLERKKYVLLNTKTKHLVMNPSGKSAKQFYASELIPIRPEEDIETITMETALKLNKVKKSATDVIWD